jgi:5,10-methylenetetrahydromethanopterin reductase
MTAAAIATVDELSKGRAILGLGAGGSAIRALGIARAHPIEAVRDSIAIIRGLTGHGYVNYTGKHFSYEGHLDFTPLRRVPIFVGTRGPRMLELAGELADGVIIGGLARPLAIRTALNFVEAGARRAKRAVSDLHKVLWLRVSISKNRELAVAAVRRAVALALATGAHMIERLNLELPHPVSEIVYRTEGTPTDETVEVLDPLLTDDVIDQLALADNLEGVKMRLSEVSSLHVDQVVMNPYPPEGSSIEEQIELFSGLARQV